MGNPLIGIGIFFMVCALGAFGFGAHLSYLQLKSMLIEEAKKAALEDIQNYMPVLKLEADDTIQVIKSGNFEYTIRKLN